MGLRSVVTVLVITAAGTGLGLADRPLKLVPRPSPDGVRVEVVGASPAAFEGRFALAVVTASGNRSTIRGSARLQAGKLAVLAGVTQLRGSAWRARLEVEPRFGESYVENIESPQSAGR